MIYYNKYSQPIPNYQNKNLVKKTFTWSKIDQLNEEPNLLKTYMVNKKFKKKKVLIKDDTFVMAKIVLSFQIANSNPPTIPLVIT